MKQNFKKVIAVGISIALSIPSAVLSVRAEEEGDTTYSEEETVLISSLVEERSTLFNDGWKFFLGKSDTAQDPNFNDSSWRDVTLPHDYSIEQEFTTSGEAESGFLPGGTGWYRKSFILPEACKDKDITIEFGGVYMNASVYINGTKLGTHPYGYTGFSFRLTDYVICDGATSNVIAVKVEHKLPSSRYYSGSGIYRNVYLNVADKVHIARYGTMITTPKLESQKDTDADVVIRTQIENTGKDNQAVSVRNTVYDGPDKISESVSSDIIAETGSKKETVQTVTVNRPVLWSLSNPYMYTVKTEILAGSEVIDSDVTNFGFRYFNFERSTGFSLNGEKMKLKGVCLHHDQGALGAAAYKDAFERQIKLLKEMGCNAIRVTHNPAADELILACEKNGVLVIDEAFDTWSKPKNGNTNDYSSHFLEKIEDDNQIIGKDKDMIWSEYDVKEMVNRGKNSPAIIMWSLGNELLEGIDTSGTGVYIDYAKNLIQSVKEIDTGRPVTFGDNKIKNSNAGGTAVQIADLIAENGGIVGLNYVGNNGYQSIYSKWKNWCIYGSETASAIGSRGVYTTKGQDNQNRQLTAYDKTAVGWGATASSAWYDIIQNDFVAGEFVWTGFDYIGEPTPWNGIGTGGVGSNNPSPKSSYFGIIDTAGFPKDDYYFYQSMWNEEVNTLYILPCWNKDSILLDNGNAEVVVYTDVPKVKLFLNGKQVAEADSVLKSTNAGYTYRLFQNGTSASNLYATFHIPYQEGTLTAKAYDENGQEIINTKGRNSVTTAGKSAALQLTADYSDGDYNVINADGSSLSYITADVYDKDGNIVPDASEDITFTIQGEGRIVGVDNGDPTDFTSYQVNAQSAAQRKAFHGKALVIVKSTKNAGNFILTASSGNLSEDSITITTKKEQDSGEKHFISFTMPRHCYIPAGAESVRLPVSAKADYSDGTSEILQIIWESYNKNNLDSVCTFKVKGIMNTSDTKIPVSVTVHVTGNVTSVLNYSGVTPVNTIPALPSVRPTILENGELYEEYPVTWSTMSAEDFSVEGNIVTVAGTVFVLGKTLPVTASIRVASPVLGEKNNIAPDYLKLTQSCTNPSDSLESITNGIINRDPNVPSERWTNWNTMDKADEPAITFTWATIHLVNEIQLYYYKDNNAKSEYPTNVKIEYSSDGTNWNPVDYKRTDGIDGDKEASSFELKEMINPIGIRIILGHTPGKFIGLTEAKIMSFAVSYPANTSADLSNISIDNTTIENFQADTLSYEVKKGSSITAASSKNAVITIVPEFNGIVKIISISEDQKNKKIYELKFKD